MKEFVIIAALAIGIAVIPRRGEGKKKARETQKKRAWSIDNDLFLNKKNPAFLAGETPHAGIYRGSIMVSPLSLFAPFRFRFVS